MDQKTAEVVEEICSTAKRIFNEADIMYDELWIEVDDRSAKGPSVVFRFIRGKSPQLEKYRKQAKKKREEIP